MILSVCWPVQLSSLQLCHTVNPRPAPRCLVIAVTKSSISVVIGAEIYLSVYWQVYLLMLDFINMVLCGLLTFLPAKLISSHLCCEVWCMHLYLWALWVAMNRERKHLLLLCQVLMLSVDVGVRRVLIWLKGQFTVCLHTRINNCHLKQDIWQCIHMCCVSVIIHILSCEGIRFPSPSAVRASQTKIILSRQIRLSSQPCWYCNSRIVKTL